MDYFLHVVYGIFVAYFSLISPGMLNMTALKISIDNGQQASIKFALGAAFIILLQAGIALIFTDYFVQNPSVIEFLKTAGVFVFFILAILFYYLSRKKVIEGDRSKYQNFIFKGMVMSALNMLSIPFYVAMTSYLVSSDKIILVQPFILFFIGGVFFGAMLLFYTYIYFSKIIAKRVSFIAKNINLILSLLFFILGMLTLVKL